MFSHRKNHIEILHFKIWHNFFFLWNGNNCSLFFKGSGLATWQQGTFWRGTSVRRSSEACKATHTQSKELTPGLSVFPHVMVQKAILREKKYRRGGMDQWAEPIGISYGGLCSLSLVCLSLDEHSTYFSPTVPRA